MPADLVAGSPRWTAADQACRDDPGACVSRCDQGDGGACYALGVGLQDHGREAEAESRFEQACRAGSAIGCTNYGAGLLPDSVSEDAEEAVCAARIFERTCAAGERLWGCGMWGFVLVRGQGVQPDPAQALTVLERSCAETEYFACDVLGLAHRQGLFGPPSIDAARQA
jgi:TPR repeat protein